MVRGFKVFSEAWVCMPPFTMEKVVELVNMIKRLLKRILVTTVVTGSEDKLIISTKGSANHENTTSLLC